MIKIILLSRTNRPSGYYILKKLLQDKKNIIAVIAEKRRYLLIEKGVVRFINHSIRTHGIFYLLNKLWEVIVNTVSKRLTSIKELCLNKKIPYYIVENHNGKESENILRNLKPDLIITANTRIIKSNILDIPTIGCINIHKSKLPKYAGLDSIFWALYHGEEEIGVTIHYLDKGIDTGDMILQETFKIMPEDTLQLLDKKATLLGADLISRAVKLLEKGTIPRIPFNKQERTYFSWPTAKQRRELKNRQKMTYERTNRKC